MTFSSGDFDCLWRTGTWENIEVGLDRCLSPGEAVHVLCVHVDQCVWVLCQWKIMLIEESLDGTMAFALFEIWMGSWTMGLSDSGTEPQGPALLPRSERFGVDVLWVAKIGFLRGFVDYEVDRNDANR